ncbi:hypothetical protein GOFOIKOB_0304 [Methylobacterium tardum]|jgi:hypothetical protein|uniref:Uncharacterized protein n=1 Tax=Methylobacterium tardum TaxID=374432 RepID=A0AA37TCU9_9HYPH|nr:hypothetical protein [Methylobacterium tardum]URD36850.1 hypothetical protein M6G65_31870 [Methylobacterium tardum]GJE47283.1 hypothetical protein GOFOIKOB_0304 [Methylobacterium tardum]GLS71346.1 hypothetical protein GCM10007890_33590 [Methylobacterium tardum]
MRALLVLMCGTVGGTMITAAGIVTVLFACMGHAGDLGRSAITLACWTLGFGFAFLVVSLVGVATGVLEPTAPAAKEASDV